MSQKERERRLEVGRERERRRVGRERSRERYEEVAYVFPPKGSEPSEVIQSELGTPTYSEDHDAFPLDTFLTLSLTIVSNCDLTILVTVLVQLTYKLSSSLRQVLDTGDIVKVTFEST